MLWKANEIVFELGIALRLVQNLLGERLGKPREVENLSFHFVYLFTLCSSLRNYRENPVYY